MSISSPHHSVTWLRIPVAVVLLNMRPPMRPDASHTVLRMPAIGELERAVQAGDADADDDNGRLDRGEREPRQGRGRRRGACGREERPARDAARDDGSTLEQAFERHAVRSRETRIAKQGAKRAQQWSSGHGDRPHMRIDAGLEACNRVVTLGGARLYCQHTEGISRKDDRRRLRSPRFPRRQRSHRSLRYVRGDSVNPRRSLCRLARLPQQALAAAERGDYEAFHDLAWRAVQTGPARDPGVDAAQLARAQALSGRPHDALVMLERLAEMGVASDAETNPEFAPHAAAARVAGRWQARIARVARPGAAWLTRSCDDSGSGSCTHANADAG